MRYSRLAFVCIFLMGACGDDDDDDDQPDTSVNDSSGGSDSAATFDSMPSNDAGPPDADPTPDAMPVETMGCEADPLVAPPMISWTGTVTTAQGMEPVADALVEVYSTLDVLAGSDTSAADGTFSITITTGGLPFDGYAKVTHVDYVTNYIYPPDPVATDIEAPALLFASSELDLLYLFGGGGMSLDPAKGTAGVLVLDCSFSPVGDAAVTFDPEAGRVIYIDPSAGAVPAIRTTGTYANGLAIGMNVPAGDISVSAVRDPAEFEAHTVGIFAGSVTTTIVHPVPSP